MFSGIIEKVGSIQEIAISNLVVRIKIAVTFDKLKLGESIALNGVCLTLVEYDNQSISFDVMPETYRIAALDRIAVGSKVNLERSLKFGSDVSGHFVSGHVDCLIELIKITPEGDSNILHFKIPADYKRFITKKGSVSISGVSLTVIDRVEDTFNVGIIPHTWTHTNFSTLKQGDFLNLEIDLFARYIVNALDSYINV